MSTYTQILYQIVFSTKYRDKTLEKENRTMFFKDIWGILKNKNCHLYRINGIEDHIHILISLHIFIALASLIKDIKLGSRHFIRHFPQCFSKILFIENCPKKDCFEGFSKV